MTNFNNKYFQKLSEDCGLYIQDGCEATIKEVEFFTEQAIKDAFKRFDNHISWLRTYFENTPDLNYLSDSAKDELEEMMGKP